MRAPNSGIHLTSADAAVVKGMIDRGDRQHDIASWFGVNGGRIAEISTGDKFAEAAMQTDNLPPRGPYLSGRAAADARDQLLRARETLLTVVEEIHEMIGKLS